MQRALYALVGVFVLVVAGGLALPRFARVEVSVLVDSPPSVVFAQANDFRRLALWAPPQSDDRDARVTYAGPPRGEGARMEWHGPIGGSGAELIVESIPYEYVSYLVNPGEAAEAASWVDIAPAAGGTRVTRGFEHDYGYNLVGRYFGLMWSGMIRRDYGLSLVRLQAVLDGLPKDDFGDLELEESYVAATGIAYVVTKVPGDAPPDPETLELALDEVRAYLEALGLDASGPAIAILRGAIGSRRRLDAAIRFTGVPPADVPPSNVVLGRAYEGYVIRATHPGSRETLRATHDKLAAYLLATGRRPNGDPWESFLAAAEPGGGSLPIAGPDTGPDAGQDGRIDRVDVVYPVLAD